MPQGETEPLLPRYDENASQHRRLQSKLRTYQMVRALSQGYMPSNDQIIVNLRRLLASDLLNSRHEDIGPVCRQLIRDSRLWIQVLIDFLCEKNSDDQLQEFLWHLSQSRASINVDRISERASSAKSRANPNAAYESLRTVGSLFLVNADFRLFLQDVTTVGRQIFSDTALSVSETSRQVGEELKPSEARANAVKGAGKDEGRKPSSEDLRQEASEVADIAGEGVSRTGKQAADKLKEHLTPQTKETLIYRLKQAVSDLRQQSDYSDSISQLTQLVQRYAKSYATAAEEASAAAEEDVGANADLKQGMQQFWALAQSIGHPEEWKLLEQKFHAVVKHANKDPEFENLMKDFGHTLQEMLTDPNFFDSVNEKTDELKKKAKNITSNTSLGEDMVAFLIQVDRTIQSVSEDPMVSKLSETTTKIYKDAVGGLSDKKNELPTDIAQVFFPILLRYVQYIPILRLEMAAPELDLLVENLILEPGRTVNYSSFLPYRAHITTRNDIDIVKKHAKRTATDIKTAFTVTVLGLNISSSEFGYWLRTHAGLFRLKDEGVASFYLDRRGLDISLDVEVGRDRLEHIFTLRGVRVVIHKLDYKIHRSKWRFLLWLTKPFLKHLVRRVLEKKIAEQIVAAANALNRELIFARERLRAARIANPKDLASFVRAVLARMKPPSDGDVEAGIGVDVAGNGIFRDVYAPGSIIKKWQDENRHAQELIEEGDETHGLGKTWRNDIFDARGSLL